MGATDIISELHADFTGIAPAWVKLYVSHVIHKAFVEVNEKGTEAAAATVVVMSSPSCAMPLGSPVFCADHPFLFMIYHKKSRAILFTGSLISLTRDEKNESINEHESSDYLKS